MGCATTEIHTISSRDIGWGYQKELVPIDVREIPGDLRKCNSWEKRSNISCK